MQKTVLSTADVARLFKVTETTVKRWADEGNLKCQKTPGGHRKYEMRYVVEFARDNKFDPLGVLALLDDANFSNAVQVAVLTRDFQALVAAFVERALSPDKTLHALLSCLYEHKIHLWEIYDHVLRPGMADIEERWARGEIGINHEHRASHETLEALSKLQAQILIKPLAGKTVLCACVGDEKHEIGLRCVANIFDSEGWRVHYLGAETPHDAIVASIRELRPSVVCLSITRPGPALDAALQAIVDALLFAEPLSIPLYGDLWISDASKETLLEVWQTIISNTGLDVRVQHEVKNVRRDEGRFVVETAAGPLRARRVVLAMGRRGNPRRLEVPGEDLPKVFYDIIEMEAFAGGRSVRYEDVLAIMRPEIGAAYSATTESVGYEGFYLGLAFTY